MKTKTPEKKKKGRGYGRVWTPEARAKQAEIFRRARAIRTANVIEKRRVADQVRIEIGTPEKSAIESVKTEGNENIEKTTINLPAMARRALRRRLDIYLDQIESVDDFNKARRENPKWALEFACDRVWGKPTTQVSGSQHQGQSTVAVLVQVLCGGQVAGPGAIGIDSKALTIIPVDLPLPVVVDPIEAEKEQPG